jgi:hypothetical protein
MLALRALPRAKILSAKQPIYFRADPKEISIAAIFRIKKSSSPLRKPPAGSILKETNRLVLGEKPDFTRERLGQRFPGIFTFIEFNSLPGSLVL